MRKLGLFFAIFLTVIFRAYAQQDPQFSQYMYNSLYLNPATAGVNPKFVEMNVFQRLQWLGYTATFDDGGSPSTQFASFSMPFAQGKSGFGFQMTNDRLGPLSSFDLQASYAYHFRTTNSGTFSFGVRAGVFNQTIDFSMYRPVDENDPLLQNTGRQNELQPDVALGVNYSYKSFFAGVGFNHLLSSKFSYGTDYTISTLVPHMNINLGANFQTSDDLMIAPSLLIKTDLNSASVDLSVVGTFKDKFILGVSGRASNAADDLIFILGTYLLKDNSLRLTYSMDYILSGRLAKQPTSHEISLGYRIPKVTQILRGAMRTPRFRH